MSKNKLCNFGKEIKKKLVDIDKSQEWLIGEVEKDTGLYFDRSYFSKTLNGTYLNPKIVASIRKILQLDNPAEKQGT